MGVPLKLSGSYLVWEKQNGCAIIWRDGRLSRVGTIRQCYRQTRQPRRHIANAATAHCIGRQKMKRYTLCRAAGIVRACLGFYKARGQEVICAVLEAKLMSPLHCAINLYMLLSF